MAALIPWGARAVTGAFVLAFLIVLMDKLHLTP